MAAAVGMLSLDDKYNTSGIHGAVHFYQSSPETKTWVYFNLHGIKPGAIHGCHIHETNDFSRGCDSLGPHFNPTNNRHGSIWLFGDDRHAGDLISNIQGDENGNFEFWYEDNKINVLGPAENSILSRSLVFHEKQDDGGYYRDQDTPLGRESAKTGNAAKRLACCEIVRTNFVPYFPSKEVPPVYPFMRTYGKPVDPRLLR